MRGVGAGLDTVRRALKGVYDLHMIVLMYVEIGLLILLVWREFHS